MTAQPVSDFIRVDLQIETPRLILRPPAAEDFEGFLAFGSDTETMRFVGGVQPPALIWRAMTALAGGWLINGFSMFSVIEKPTGRWIGRIGPLQPHGWPGAEMGWGLLPEFQGKGYATEAAAAAMDFVVDRLGWTDIIHCIDPANAPSAGVARRLGSRLRGEATLPPPFDDAPVEIWGQSAAEWAENRKALTRGDAA